MGTCSKIILNDESNNNSKKRILNVATKLFAQSGFDGTSIRQICKYANVNISMISYFWGGKSELYKGIIENLIAKQNEYAKSFVDFDMDFTKLTKQEQVKLLFKVLERFADFFYSNINSDLILFLIREQQQQPNFVVKVPAILFLRRLLAAVLKKDEKDKEIILKTVFIISQINSPRIMPAFSLNALGQNDFTKEDIKLIKNNLKKYVQMLLKEAGIE